VLVQNALKRDGIAMLGVEVAPVTSTRGQQSQLNDAALPAGAVLRALLQSFLL
jgi:hypothetical protein